MLPRLGLEEGQRLRALMLLTLHDPDRVHGEGELWIQPMRLLEIGNGGGALGELDIEHAARDVERGRIRKTAETGIEDIDADLKGLVGESDGSKVEIVADVVGRLQDGLTEESDCLGRLAFAS